MDLGDIISKIGISIAPIIPVIFLQLKWYRASAKENKVITDSLKENYAQTSEMKADLKKHIDSSNFSGNLHGVIQTRAVNLIKTSGLDPKFTTILKTISRKLESLAFSYYFNKLRKVEYEMVDFLEVEIGDIENSIKKKVHLEIKDSKIFKYDRGREHIISFYDFMFSPEKTPFSNLGLLRIVLEENGFEEEDGPDFIETMDKFTKLILTQFIDEVKAWHKIETMKEEKTYD